MARDGAARGRAAGAEDRLDCAGREHARLVGFVGARDVVEREHRGLLNAGVRGVRLPGFTSTTDAARLVTEVGGDADGSASCRAMPRSRVRFARRTAAECTTSVSREKCAIAAAAEDTPPHEQLRKWRGVASLDFTSLQAFRPFTLTEQPHCPSRPTRTRPAHASSCRASEPPAMTAPTRAFEMADEHLATGGVGAAPIGDENQSYVIK